MNYYINLFSPETYAGFARSDRTVCGFSRGKELQAKRVKPGDLIVCYLTKLSRWCGLLEVVDGPFEDHTPIFVPENDPYIWRFHVTPIVWLPVQETVPIHEQQVWSHLSFTKKCDPKKSSWTMILRSSLNQLHERDGTFLSTLLQAQQENPTLHALSERDEKKLRVHTINRLDKVVSVSVPEDDADDEQLQAVQQAADGASTTRESLKIQALLAQIGAQMGMKIWLPKADRGGVLKQWRGGHDTLLERLPLNYDDATLRTIEQIDVLWLKGRSIVRAFEVEHTTSVYSGILRMADLLALQPNMNIKLHIVAPESRQEKVFQEIRRPVFSLLEKGPLSESCTYISYDSLLELSKQKHLGRMTDAVLDDYAQQAE